MKKEKMGWTSSFGEKSGSFEMDGAGEKGRRGLKKKKRIGEKDRKGRIQTTFVCVGKEERKEVTWDALGSVVLT